MWLALACCALSAIGIAQTVNLSGDAAVRERRAEFGEMLELSRTVDREAESTHPNYTIMEPASLKLLEHSRAIPTWFPAGSGTESGARTNAMPEIWSDWSGFRRMAANAASASQSLNTAVKSRNVDAVRNAEHDLAVSCRACHHAYEYGF